MNNAHHSLTLPLLLITLMMFTAACGQKGDLYLPDKPVQAQTQQDDDEES